MKDKIEILNFYKNLKVEHISASQEDLSGNNGIGRYVFLTGSPARAEIIATHFEKTSVISHPRGHHLYKGILRNDQNSVIDVASISTGMGASSADIIINELFSLGAKRFIRVGTAGSLQKNIKCGDAVIATAAVIDNDAASGYVPAGYPAIASREIVNKMETATLKLGQEQHTHIGIIHSKSSLFSREILKSAFPNNIEYMENLKKIGVFATEMECSQLFILSSLFNHFLEEQDKVLCGAVLGIIGDENTAFSNDTDKKEQGIDLAIKIALETVISTPLL